MKNKVLKILIGLQNKNGGITATPESGAYPYVYPRDAVIMTKALNRNKQYKMSEKFYHFLSKHAKLEQYKEIFHRYNVDGTPAVTRKHEMDNNGLVLHGIYDTYLHSNNESFLQNMWPLIEQIVESINNSIKSGLVKTERSIHEFYRLEHGNEIWANCACCRGLYDAAEIAKVLNHEKEYKAWNKKAKDLHKKIKSKLLVNGMYRKSTLHKKTPDMSQLSPFYFDLDNSKPRLRKTLKYLKQHLWYEELGGFRRFRKFELVVDWHWYSGGSGSWCVLTAWAAKFYKQLNDKKNYNQCKKWLKKILKKTKGLLPEHIATKQEYEQWKANEIEFNSRIVRGMKKSEALSKKYNQNTMYWALPLGWSHAEYLLIDEK